jgi:hypothetical protein
MKNPDPVIVVVMEGGVVQNVLNIPENASVIVKDYDANEDDTCYHDENGDPLAVSVYGAELTNDQIKSALPGLIVWGLRCPFCHCDHHGSLEKVLRTERQWRCLSCGNWSYHPEEKPATNKEDT